MKLNLTKKVSAKYIVEGFPGVGLVAPISTEYLINHMKFERIGEIVIEEVMPVAAIHNEEVIKPVSLQFNKEKGIIVIHGVTNVTGLEWKIKDVLLELSKKTNCKTIISIEGVGNPDVNNKIIEPRTFVYTNNKKILPKGIQTATPLKEGIILGVTGALILNNEEINHICVFVDAHMNIPDSKAASEVIKVLDKILDIDVDVKPLLKKAELFEKKLQNILEKSRGVQKLSDDKKLTYFG